MKILKIKNFKNNNEILELIQEILKDLKFYFKRLKYIKIELPKKLKKSKYFFNKKINSFNNLKINSYFYQINFENFGKYNCVNFFNCDYFKINLIRYYLNNNNVKIKKYYKLNNQLYEVDKKNCFLTKDQALFSFLTDKNNLFKTEINKNQKLLLLNILNKFFHLKILIINKLKLFNKR